MPGLDEVYRSVQEARDSVKKIDTSEKPKLKAFLDAVDSHLLKLERAIYFESNKDEVSG